MRPGQDDAPQQPGSMWSLVEIPCNRSRISRAQGPGGLVQGPRPPGRLNAASILEIGAGSGRLAADILGRLETLNKLPQRYWILEISPELRDRQRQHLKRHQPRLLERVQWLDRPPDEPFDGVIANEVLDALPVARFRWHADAVEELGVVQNDGRFAWAGRPAGETLAEECRSSARPGRAARISSRV